MTSRSGAAPVSSLNPTFKRLTNEFQDVARAQELFDEFLRQRTYRKTFCLKLLDLAKRRTGVSWEIRRLATLMAENQILKLHKDKLDDFDALLVQLNLKQPGLQRQITASVLKEGYSTTEPSRFILEFRRKLARLDRVHRNIRGRKTTDAALLEFIELSRRDCKLTLARYLFTPDDVVNEILRQVKLSDGVRDLEVSRPRFIDAEITHALRTLPDFEAGIMQRLCAAAKVYWVAETTSSRINSLVEYPLATVVLVVKPPGSHIEFELKRAGRKGQNPINVVFKRNGNNVPPFHRLDGGSMQWLLRYEARNASRLSAIFRLVHGAEAPVPGYVCRNTIFSVPSRSGQSPAFRYFTDHRDFGEAGFQEMRLAMAGAVKALQKEEGENLPELPGDMALTAEFLSHVAPAQAIITGTSSFRIDKVATYLSGQGAETYFKIYRGVDYTAPDAKQFADELLEEVLGVYDPPDVEYEDFERYVEAAYGVPENRARADQIFLNLVRQMAEFWGTLLGVRGHSRGESFVARNVGLRSVWDQGQWRVTLVFMDHDALSLPELENGHFYAQSALPGMLLDERHVWGRANLELFPVSLVGYLLSIYRIGETIEAEAKSLAQQELKTAYHKTHQALLSNPKMRAFFSDVFVSRLFDWDKFVAGYLRREDAKVRTTWEEKMKKRLAAKGYERDAFDYYMQAAEKNSGFLERNAFLFQAE